MTISVNYVGGMLDSLLGANYNTTTFPNAATMTLGLSSTAPTNTGGNITEPNGGGYARVSVQNNGTNWAATSNGSKANASAINFPAATSSWGNVSYWFLFDSNNTFVVSGTLANAPISVASGSAPSFAAGALVVSES